MTLFIHNMLTESQIQKRKCPCGKWKAICIIHGGGAICPCGRRKVNCSKHGGGALCPCGRNKYLCVIHGGASTCPCGKRKQLCSTHGGTGLCECGKRKDRCSIHGGSELCPCGKIKHSCKDHRGGAFCKCNILKKYCKVHGGSRICKKCNMATSKTAQNLCKTCDTVQISTSRIKEKRVAHFLQQHVKPTYDKWNRAVRFDGDCVNSRFRPDFVWEISGCADKSKTCYAVILEVDENQHKYMSYSLGCELARVADIVQGYGGVPVHLIRFNPDSFTLGSKNKTRTNCREAYRFALLKSSLESALESAHFVDNILTIEWLFYDDKDGNEVKKLTFQTINDYMAWASQQTQQTTQATENANSPV